MRLASLSAAAAAAERSADWDATNLAFQRLFWAAVDAGDLEVAANALRGHSRAHQHLNRLEEAEEFADLSLEIADRSGFAAAAARAINTLAVIRFMRHDPQGARELYARALERATDCGDDALIGWSCQNLGVLANLGGDLREARALYLESIAAAVRSGDGTTAMTAYNSLGLISADLEEWTDSVLYFDRGLEVAAEFGDVALRAALLANRAEPLIYIGETDRALAALQEAEAIALEIDDQRTLSEVHRFRGIIGLMQHRSAEAAEHLELAVRIAEAAGLPLEQAEATEEVARLRWSEGRAGAARVMAREALREYERLGAEQNAIRVRHLLESWAAAP